VIAREKQLDDALVTVVVTHRVPADQGDAFLEWHKKVVEKESKYPGFRDSEVFRPIEGLQDDWVIAYKFDTAEHLDAWLVSQHRRELLEDPRFGDFKLRKIDHSFGNWFAFGDCGGTRHPDPRPRYRQAADHLRGGCHSADP